MLNKKALAATAAAQALYVEDVFSTYLYTGNGSTQTITNGIDLAGEGGMIWTKERSPNARNHFIGDSARDNFRNYLYPNLTNAQSGLSGSGFDIFSVSSTGYSLGADNYTWNNESGSSQVSWTFRKAEKFFDVVTYTGNGTAGRTVSHNLGSVPGVIIVKCTSEAQSWAVYHRSLGNTKRLILQTTAASTTSSTWNDTDPTSTVFSVDDGDIVNKNGATYVAYLFAHDAGGFGDSGSDSVIKCGSFAGGDTIDLGWEPQFFIWKRTDGTSDWRMHDNMRGFPTGGTQAVLAANLSSAETTNTFFDVNPTGLKHLGSGGTYVYIAIRRGPMKTPTVGSDVFRPRAQNASSTTVVPTTFPVDLIIGTQRSRATYNSTAVFDRLRGTRGMVGGAKVLNTNNTNSEDSDYGQDIDRMGDFLDLFFNTAQGVTSSTAYWAFRRAPGFFDIVCYTGTGSATTFSHNLGVAPELMIVKRRNSTGGWITYWSSLGATKYQVISDQPAGTLSIVWNDTAPTSSVFTVGTDASLNASGGTYVNYLFATCSGVSKVGSYTGNGSSQTINCGFTTGARFVLIKRTDSTGDWWVFDTARGIIASNDPALRLNTTNAETTTVDSIDPDNSGFIVVQNATTNVNVSSASYIYLAIA